MHSPNDQPKPHEGAMQGDPSRDRQLELEIQAFAELLLDIYEYRHQQKRRNASPQSTFDDGSMDRKMK
jgi:hypothetical protein